MPSGCAASNLMLLCPSLPVGAYRPSALFLKIAQNLSCWKVFGATFFQKGSKNSWLKLTTNPTSLFLLAQKAQKKKLCKKKTPFLWGVAPNPIRFLKKAKPKTFKLGVRAIKFEAANLDGIELIKVERTFFEK